ncbi:MAG: hypothetical protein RIC35_05760 [Marinoscillum sp.]
MAELKTRPNDLSVEEFLNNLENETKRNDSFELVKIMSKITGSEPVMWGPAIIGFGNHHYVYESGREGDWFLGFHQENKHSLFILCQVSVNILN